MKHLADAIAETEEKRDELEREIINLLVSKKEILREYKALITKFKLGSEPQEIEGRNEEELFVWVPKRLLNNKSMTLLQLITSAQSESGWE